MRAGVRVLCAPKFGLLMRGTLPTCPRPCAPVHPCARTRDTSLCACADVCAENRVRACVHAPVCVCTRERASASERAYAPERACLRVQSSVCACVHVFPSPASVLTRAASVSFRWHCLCALSLLLQAVCASFRWHALASMLVFRIHDGAGCSIPLSGIPSRWILHLG